MLDEVRPDAAAGVVRAVFGHGGFRAGQAAAVAAVLGGRDALVVLPTGGGKSLCYQVPAVMRARHGAGTTIVVSPLIALMEDQVAALRGRGVIAAALHSHLDEDAQREVIDALLAGQLELLYVSPERAVLDSFKRLLSRVAIALVAIDEAHCVAQWGHDFRPEYLRLAELRDVVVAPTIALTATATPRVMAEVAKALALVSPATVVGDFARPNLRFTVEHHRSDATRLAATVAACEEAGLRRTGAGRAIVYCSTRKKAEDVADGLKSAGFAAGYYHAGRTALARDRAQRSFAGGRTRVLVATSAFGMGIDHGDVRLVVHFQAPGSLEAYYQEAGRAGRDGAPATCALLFGPADLITQRKLAGDRGGPAMQARRDEALASIERYAATARCRQAMLCGHFTGAEHAACGRCDVCVAPEPSVFAVAAPVIAPPLPAHEVEVVLAAIGHLARPVGAGTLAKALRGSRAKAVDVCGLLRLPEHGALVDADEDAIVAAIDGLVRARKVVRRGRRFPTIALAGAAAPARRERAPRERSASPRRPKAGLVRGRGGLTSELARDLDLFRRRTARALSWKTYMVFQERVIRALDVDRPRDKAALLRVPGLGPAKVERFGDDLLALIRRHVDG